MSNKDEKILETMDIMIKNRNKNLENIFDKHIEAKITAVNLDGTYGISINNQTISSVKCRNGSTFLVNDVVEVLIPRGNFSRMIIDYKY
jgi:hypothetical protein